LGIKLQTEICKSLCILIVLMLTPIAVYAYDVNEKLNIEGTLTGIYQLSSTNIDKIKSVDRGAAVFDLRGNFHPTEQDEFQVKFKFGAGNGLNYIRLFSVLPYAGDLEDNLKNINGRNRDYLLEAWYKHTFKFSETASLGITGGIIDSRTFIDNNAFANDEVAQFMNEVFVNHNNVNLPSYDLGVATEMKIAKFYIRGVMMDTKFEAGRDNFKNYNYFALQLGYAIETSLGEGNYRLYGFSTNKKFLSCKGKDEERLKGIGISFDQKLGEIVGVFLRASWQDDAAAIDHDTIYSGGLNINGKLWKRENDEIGIAYAYLHGDDESDIKRTNVLETYVKFKLSKHSDVTLDLQYINDKMRGKDDRNGVIYGVRANAYF
jgi:hypothetical protein